MGRAMSEMRLIVPFVLAVILPSVAGAQNGPCETDANGDTYCYNNDSANMLEATCLSSADPRYCFPYHQRACQVNGFALACKMANLGQNCSGGDPAMCNYYVQILQANRSCNMQGDQQACEWMRQQGL